MRWNAGNKSDDAPDTVDELLLYQTLVGAWPVHRSQRAGFGSRVRNYMHKAAREAKRKTSWRDPDARYEAALDRFVRRILAPSNARFVEDVERFASDVALHGAVNSLARLLVKVAAPGVPDFYQGAELWHLRLVDPDNREPVDFEARSRMLERIESRAAKDLGSLATELLEHWTDGAVKLFVTWRALTLRRRWPEVFAHGAYVELATDARTLAFARRRGRRWVVVCVPRFSTRTGFGSFALGSASGRRTIRLPDGAPRRYENVLTGEAVEANRGSFAVADAFRRFPVALLVATKTP
jgi:(1->4)-alpha-D-glucan 1-alpha-D-glucosylmutase